MACGTQSFVKAFIAWFVMMIGTNIQNNNISGVKNVIFDKKYYFCNLELEDG